MIPNEGATPLRLGSILAWQVIAGGVAVGVLLALGRGSALSVFGGGAVLTSSMLLGRIGMRFATRHQARPAAGMAFFLAKLFLVGGFVAAGIAMGWLDPVSFAAGVTTLPVAIVLDACYPLVRR